MGKEQIAEKMVKKVMKDFDFIKVHRIMVLMKHKWAGVDGTEEVPSLYCITKRAEELLRTCASHYGDKDNFTTSCGGFTATLDVGALSLQYVPEEKTSYDMDYK